MLLVLLFTLLFETDMKRKEFYLNCVMMFAKASLETYKQVDLDFCAQSSLDLMDAVSEKWNAKYGTPIFE